MMKIGIIGTGVVGQTLAAHLNGQGHQVWLGTRDPAKTRANEAPGPFGLPPVQQWLQAHPGVELVTFAEAAAEAEVLLNATGGMVALQALEQAGSDHLKAKILIDISNPLDFSKGFPPTLAVCNTDSLGEQIQAAFPHTHVVKALNTVTAALMVNPGQLADGEHDLLICGNVTQAKEQVSTWLKDWFGWKHIVDLGDISQARGTEMYLPLWVRLYGALGTPIFNLKLVKNP